MGGKHLVIAAVLLGMAAVLPAAVSAQVPADAKALLDQAQTALSAKQWQQAADALSALVILDPRWFNFQNLGAAEFNLGRYEKAIAAYDKASRRRKRTGIAIRSSRLSARCTTTRATLS